MLRMHVACGQDQAQIKELHCIAIVHRYVPVHQTCSLQHRV